MASFEIEWKRSAAKELRKLPKDMMPRIIAAVEGLAADPSSGRRAQAGGLRAHLPDSRRSLSSHL